MVNLIFSFLQQSILKLQEKWKVDFMSKMKSARFYRQGEPLRIEYVEIPKIGPSDVLIQVKACGLTPSMIPSRKMIPPLKKVPVTYGHQFSGIIAEVGEAVEGFRKGDRVFIDYYVGCNKCPACLSGRHFSCSKFSVIGKNWGDGGLAEFVRVPATNVFILPDAISFEEGALIFDPIGVGFHAVRRGNVKGGSTVAVYGGGGAVGTSIIQAAKVDGAGLIIAVDTYDHRLDLARKLGADETVNSKNVNPVKKIKDLTDEKGVDIAFDACGGMGIAGEIGNVTYEQAMASTRFGGRTVIVSTSWGTFKCDPLRFALEEFELIGSHGCPRADISTILKLLLQGKIQIKPIISHTFSLDEVNYALDILKRQTGEVNKIIIKI
jgi:threonine dehydrogenase-like Zn-dependent dehydrogenase